METSPPDGLRWDLSDLYPSADHPRLGDDLARSRALADELAAHHRGRIALLSPAQLAEVLATYERLLEVAYRPQIYASLLFAEQTQSERAQALIALTRETVTETMNRVKFLDVE